MRAQDYMAVIVPQLDWARLAVLRITGAMAVTVKVRGAAFVPRAASVTGTAQVKVLASITLHPEP
jgi:hypothetical protein